MNTQHNDIEGSSGHTVPLHVLCHDCKAFCIDSILLNDRSAWNTDNHATTHKTRERRRAPSQTALHTVDYFGDAASYFVSKSDRRRMKRLIGRHALYLAQDIVVKYRDLCPSPKRKAAESSGDDASSTDQECASNQMSSGEDSNGEKSDLSLDSARQSARSISRDSRASLQSIIDSSDGSAKSCDEDASAACSPDSVNSYGSYELYDSQTSEDSAESEPSLTRKRRSARLPSPEAKLKKMQVDIDWKNTRTVTAAQLIQSASRGCHLCNLLIPRSRYSRNKCIPKLSTRMETLRVSVSSGIWHGGSQIFIFSLVAARFSDSVISRVVRVRPVKEALSTHAKFAGVEKHQEPSRFDFTQDSHPARDSTTTSADAIIATISRWLDQCLTTHTDCNRIARQPGGPPSRLIALRNPSSLAHDDYVYLHMTKPDIDQRIQYVALSHRWGGSELLRLQRDNVESFQEGIHISMLPKTFQDSVEICRKLRVDYLWIDSLCIIYDDKEDWNREVASMDRVYANCAWSLAALHGSDSQAGCFATRDPRSYLPCKLPGKADVFAETYSRVPNLGRTRRRLQGTELMWSNLMDDKEPGAELSQRAWVLQERMLAPRTVYFGARNVHWECRTCDADDLCPDAVISNAKTNPKRILDAILDVWNGENVPSWVVSPPREHKAAQSRVGDEEVLRGRRLTSRRLEKASRPRPGDRDSRTRKRSLSRKSLRRLKFSVAWSKIVNLYTTKGLTRHTDRLAALQGIIKIVESGTGLSPFFGMWKETLFDDLLWRNLHDGTKGETGIAPSFSWASTDGTVERMRDWCHYPSQRQCVILDSGLDTSSPTEGFVEVFAKLIDLSSAWIRPRKPKTKHQLRFQLECVIDQTTVYHDVDISLDCGFDDKQNWYLMPMAVFKRTGDENCTHGLVLRESSRGKDNYTRIGCFELGSPLRAPIWWDTLANGEHKTCIIDQRFRLV